MTSTTPLSPEDRHLLARLARSRRLEWRLVLVLGPLALGMGLLVLWIARTQLHGDDRTLSTAFALGVLCLTTLSIRATWQRQQRQGAPLREVLAHGHKQITRGTLAAVRAAPGGSVAYQLDDQAFTMTPILDQVGGLPPLLVERLHSIETVHDAEVELHWIALPCGQRLLLQAHYLPASAARWQVQPRDAEDVARVVSAEKRFLAISAGIFALV